MLDGEEGRERKGEERNLHHERVVDGNDVGRHAGFRADIAGNVGGRASRGERYGCEFSKSNRLSRRDYWSSGYTSGNANDESLAVLVQ